MSSFLTKQDLRDVSTENIIRLCKYLKIDPATNWDRKALIAWLVYQGHIGDGRLSRRHWD